MYVDDPEGAYVDEWPVFAGHHGNVMQDTTEIQGNCVFTAYHVTEIRGTADDSTTFFFDKTAPELDFDGYDMDENGFIAEFEIDYAPIEDYGHPDLNVYVGHVDRNEDCTDANYVFVGQATGGDTISERIGYHDQVCVRVMDDYNQSDEANAILPDPKAGINTEDLDPSYYNDFPEEISGTLENWMQDSSVAVIFECNGPNGDYWYDGEEWETNSTEFEPDHDSSDWTFEIYRLPPTLGHCKITVLHLAEFRPTGGAATGFDFNAEELSGSVVLGEDALVANGCEGHP